MSNTLKIPPLELVPAPEMDTEERKSQLDIALSFALEQVELFHDANKVCYAKRLNNGYVWRLTSQAFKDYLFAAFHQTFDKALRSQNLTEVINQLSAIARCERERRDVHCRVAEHEGDYYIDLCENNSTRAVRWGAAGWQVINEPPVDFVRTDAMQALPEPKAGGNLNVLWQVCNIPQAQRWLFVTWVIDAWRPDTVYPGLELIGEQGSGKSTTADIARRLIDPSSCNLRSAPKNNEDIFVTAGVNHVVAYENLSHLPSGMQDTLCVLTTGAGHAKRKLYSDSDEHVINVKRPWLINGISACVTQQDLVDRTISIECPVIKTRSIERQQRDLFLQAWPAIFGALLEIACAALKHIPGITLPEENRPRLIEFCLLGMGITKHLFGDADYFLQRFIEERKDIIGRTIEASPVCLAVVALMEKSEVIEGPLSDIMLALSAFKHSGTDAWPKTAKGLGDTLRRSGAALRQLGIECRSLGKVGSHVKWRIEKKDILPSRACRDVVAANPQQDMTTCTTSTNTLSKARNTALPKALQ
jgi:hypothetical protein